MNEDNKILIKQDYATELANTKQLCEMLMKTSHYSKMGQEGIFAVVEAAKSLDVDPRQALGGGLYYVKGKVEMSSRMMNALIRSKKHSITRDKRSDEKICILHGKRADNGDTWTESFSLEDASRAGLLGNNVWKIYPKDMLFARALSRLARQLFPDVIGNCYVEGEIALDKTIKSKEIFEDECEDEILISESDPIENKFKNEKISESQCAILDSYLMEDPEAEERIKSILNIESVYEMKAAHFNGIVKTLSKRKEAKENVEVA